MSETKFTPIETKTAPGPWYETADRIRDEASDAIVATIEDGGHVEIEIFSSADRKKHARLIAAAPEMLEALKATLEELRLIRMKDCDAVYDPSCRILAQIAISKAEGSQP